MTNWLDGYEYVSNILTPFISITAIAILHKSGHLFMALLFDKYKKKKQCPWDRTPMIDDLIAEATEKITEARG
ncbi:MAG: hypothetical protein ABI876_17680 [Bacteroidota bacterium]